MWSPTDDIEKWWKKNDRAIRLILIVGILALIYFINR